MIRPMKPSEREDVLEFLYLEPEINLYIIKEVESFDLDNPHQEVYVETEEEGYVAVVSRNWSNLIFYTPRPNFNDAWIPVFQSFDFLFISAKSELIEAIHPYFPAMEEDRMDFMRSTLFTPDQTMDYSDVHTLESREEAAEVYDLLSTVEELYTVHQKSKKEYVEFLYHHSGENGTTVYVRRDGRIVATASAVYESKRSAMIVAVATHKDYRKQGHGKKVMHTLMDLYINQKKKTLCLYYDDPRAEKLYKQMGFIDTHKWSMLYTP
ncbi:MAG: GNAT family N-acetyltransferase [Bacillota bacterium]